MFAVDLFSSSSSSTRRPPRVHRMLVLDLGTASMNFGSAVHEVQLAAQLVACACRETVLVFHLRVCSERDKRRRQQEEERGVRGAVRRQSGAGSSVWPDPDPPWHSEALVGVQPPERDRRPSSAYVNRVDNKTNTERAVLSDNKTDIERAVLSRSSSSGSQQARNRRRASFSTGDEGEERRQQHVVSSPSCGGTSTGEH